MVKPLTSQLQMKWILRLVSCLVLLCTQTALHAQPFTIKGHIADNNTRSPLAFVSIGTQGAQGGTSSDIEGRFKIDVQSLPATLVFSYVGYERKSITINPGDGLLLNVLLRKKDVQLKEVVVKAGPNPAIRIIKKVVENRDKNNPEKLSSYSYTSYNKLILTANSDSLEKAKGDTSRQKMIKFFERSHLFLLETVTQKKFREPNLVNENITGIRASGFKDPSFMALATQLQSFTFYNELIELSDKVYINPVSKNSENKYIFTLEDTLYEGVDSVFVISFQPRSGKNFNGLKGVLYINTNGYAIQNVIAGPNVEENLGIRIQQKYELISGKWFPVQLNTDLIFKNASFNKANLVGIGRTYLSDIKIDPPLKRSEFVQIEMVLEPDASAKKDTFWNIYRPDTLDKREQNTYKVIDSVGKANNLDKKIRNFIALSSGRIPIKKVDLELDKLIRYNFYEGIRLGLGAHTNSTFSRVVNFGGYFGYGFKDKGFKWGADASVRIVRTADIRLKAAWTSDVFESGMPDIRGMRQASYNERVRNTALSRFDFWNKGEISLSFRTPGYLRFVLFGNHSRVDAKYTYNYLPVNATTEGDTVHTYTFTETGLSLRFAYKEKLFDTGKVLASLGTDYPVFYLQFTHGFNGLLNGQYEYNKLDFKVEKTFTWKNIGKPSICLWAGYVDRAVPYALLYTSRANFNPREPVSIASVYSFETMRINEFLADRYVTLFFRHNFQNLLFKGKKFRPEFVITTNAGWGMLRDKNRHLADFTINTMDKVFLESGLIINNIINLRGFTGIGVGGFYRYGAHSLPSWKDNLAVKVSLNLSF